MTEPVRIQLRRSKGWKLPENTVVVSRPSKWGNPFPIKGVAAHLAPASAWVVLQYGFWIDRLDYFAGKPAPPTHDEIRDALRGKNLACWCKLGDPCHADVLLEIANAPPPPGKP